MVERIIREPWQTPAAEDEELANTVTVIIVNYNALQYLDACLASVLAASPACEVIVIDNGSSDESMARAAERYPAVQFISLGENCGYGGAINVAARAARGRYLAFLNPDTTVEAGWLEPLIALLDREPETGLVTPLIVHMDSPDKVNTCGLDVHFTGFALCRELNRAASAITMRVEVGAISGAAFAMRRRDFVALGEFDPAYFLYMEDTDLSWRARLAGFRCVAEPQSVVLHRYRLRFGARKTYLQERNRYLLLLKHMRWRTLALLLPALLVAEVVAWGFVLVCERRNLSNKLRAYWWVISHWDEIMHARARTQALRQVPDRSVLAACTFRLDYAQVGNRRPAQLANALLNPLFFVLFKISLCTVD